MKTTRNGAAKAANTRAANTATTLQPQPEDTKHLRRLAAFLNTQPDGVLSRVVEVNIGTEIMEQLEPMASRMEALCDADTGRGTEVLVNLALTKLLQDFPD